MPGHTYLPTDLDINPEFTQALHQVTNSHKHLLITGEAGTGKSTLLQLIRRETSKNTVVLAPTGLAAVNIQGQTIHSFFRFAPNINLQQAVIEGRKRHKDKVILELELLIIDEISMVRADLLDCIDIFLQASRDQPTPFGGVQIVMIGDIFQLPPILNKQQQIQFQELYPTPYFFSSRVFTQLLQNPNQFEYLQLQTLYRQTDPEFISLLRNVRLGISDPQILSALNQQLQPDIPIESQDILLATTNKTVDDLNYHNLNKLPSPVVSYTGIVTGKFSNQELPTPSVLDLKEGAKVMFVKNDPAGRWVNGSLGVVLQTSPQSVIVDIDGTRSLEVKPVTWEIYQAVFNSESQSLEQEVVGTYTQIPLKPAWAITIHKSQGQTFNSMILDMERGAFTTGQTYVALSRCRSLQGLKLLKPIRPGDIRVDKQVLTFFQHLPTLNSSKL